MRWIWKKKSLNFTIFLKKVSIWFKERHTGNDSISNHDQSVNPIVFFLLHLGSQIPKCSDKYFLSLSFCLRESVTAMWLWIGESRGKKGKEIMVSILSFSIGVLWSRLNYFGGCVFITSLELEVTFCLDIEFCSQTSSTHSKCLCLTFSHFALKFRDRFPPTSRSTISDVSFLKVQATTEISSQWPFWCPSLTCKIRLMFQFVFCFSCQVILRIFQWVESNISVSMNLKARVNKFLEKMVLRYYCSILGNRGRDTVSSTSVTLNQQWFCLPGDIWQQLETIFYCHNLGRGVLLCLVKRHGDATRHSTMHRTPLQPTMIWPQMSVVPCLRNPAI